MTLAEMHQRLDHLEGLLEEEIDIEKTESARRLDRLRALKNKTASMRVALAMGREQINTLISSTKEAA